MGSKIIKFEIVNVKFSRVHNIEILFGNNYGYLFTEYDGITRDILFINDHDLQSLNTNIIPYKISENPSVSRLLLINLSIKDDVYICDIDITKEMHTLSRDTSAQISCFDVKNKIFPYKECIQIENDKFFEFYRDNNEISLNIFDIIKNYFQKSEKSVKFEELKAYVKNCEFLIDIFFIKLNIPKFILQTDYSDQKYFNFVSICSLILVFNELFEDKTFTSASAEELYNYFMDYKNNLESDNCNNFIKNFVIMEFAYNLRKAKNVSEFKKLNFKYHITNRLKENSPLKEAIIFLHKFIKELDGKSPFYYPLVLIDSGVYTFDNKKIYGYGLNSIELLKKHLEDIMPEVLITIEDPDIFDLGITNVELGSIVLNLNKIFKSLNIIDISESIEEEKKRKKYAFSILLTLFHELCGHKKDSYNIKSDEIPNSPYYFYNINTKNIMELVNRDSNSDDNNVIKILRANNSDEGSFLELFFGVSKYGYIIDLIEIMNQDGINLNLLFDTSLWNKKIHLLREYVEKKYLIYKESKNLLNYKDFPDIESEILFLNKIIDNNKIIFSKHNNELLCNEGHKFVITNNVKNKKMIERDINNNDINYDYYKNLSFNEIKSIINKDNQPPKLKTYLRKLLLNKIIK